MFSMVSLDSDCEQAACKIKILNQMYIFEFKYGLVLEGKFDTECLQWCKKKCEEYLGITVTGNL